MRTKILPILLWIAVCLLFASAASAVCGDTVLDAGEQCDDGNTAVGDCCSDTCQLEPLGSLCDAGACFESGSCDGAGACEGVAAISCDDGLLCNGAETCDPVSGCQAGVPGLGALFQGDIVVADARTSDPMVDPFIVKIDPESGAQTPLSVGGFLVDPRDVAVEANRCLIVPDTVSNVVLRIDPLSFDPLDPAANQHVLAQGGSLVDPRGVVIAPDGTIFVADFSAQHRIHRIDPSTGAQNVVAQGGHLNKPRHVTIGADGSLYVPLYTGSSAPGVVRIDPDAYDPGDPFANQQIVASGGFFEPVNGPWDLQFDLLGRLLVVNAQDFNLIRVDVGAYEPGNPYANQEIVGDSGSFVDIRGIALAQNGRAIVTNNGGVPKVIAVDPDEYDPLDRPANQTVIASGPPMDVPHGVDVVGVGRCGNGVLESGEQCDDGNESSGDCCSQVCEFESAGASCTVDACTVGGTCDGAGACTGTTPVVCDDGQFCNGAESCDPALGCQAGAPPALDDGVTCTDDSCDEAGDAVVHVPNHGFCSDGLFCTGAEVCDPALDCQAGTPPPIDDGVACTADSCDEAGDVVVHAPDHGSCSDGLFCNGAEICDPALDCRPGAPPALDDGIACTADSCDEAGDMVVHAPNDGLCDDGQFCTGVETCSVALGCLAGAPPMEDDGVSCTDEICDELGDSITHVANDAHCDDGLLCTGAEVCDPVQDCQAGPPQYEGVLSWGDIVIADPRTTASLDPIIVAVDPLTGATTSLSSGGFLNDPRDVAVEANRCVLVPDYVTHAVIRIDPLAYDEQNPGANQTILSQGGDLGDPRGIAIAGNGLVFVADNSSQDRIVRLDPITGAQSLVAKGGHIDRPRHLTVDRSGRYLYVPLPTGASAASIVRIDTYGYDSSDPFANQVIVAQDGYFAPLNGPWDLVFDRAQRLLVINAQNWNLIRVDVDAFDPGNPFANQQVVGNDGSFIENRGIALGRNGWPVVTNEGGGVPMLFTLDPDAFQPLDPEANQVVIASGPPLVEPRGTDVVGPPPARVPLPGWAVAALVAIFAGSGAIFLGPRLRRRA